MAQLVGMSGSGEDQLSLSLGRPTSLGHARAGCAFKWNAPATKRGVERQTCVEPPSPYCTRFFISWETLFLLQ